MRCSSRFCKTLLHIPPVSAARPCDCGTIKLLGSHSFMSRFEYVPFQSRHVARLSVLAVILFGAQYAHAQRSVATKTVPVECGGPTITNHYGPWDYTDPIHFRDRLPIVESAHFTVKVETLEGGETGFNAGGDLDYTLRAFPNHHRALHAMGRYQLVHGGSGVPPEAKWTADCYFQRAIGFKPRDGVVRMLYGIYLAKAGRPDDALSQYRVALELIPNSAELHNNIALLQIDRRDFDSARHHALRADELGFPLAGARGKLERLGEWRGASSKQAETED